MPILKKLKRKLLSRKEAHERSVIGASNGGKARAKVLSPQRRAQIARNAALARWRPTKAKKVA